MNPACSSCRSRLSGARGVLTALCCVLGAALYLSAPSSTADDLVPPDWPRLYEHELGEVVVYQPQFTHWSHAAFKARCAAAVWLTDDEYPYYCSFSLSGKAEIDLGERVVALYDLVPANVRFADTDPALKTRLARLLSRSMSQPLYGVALETVLASVPSLPAAARDIPELVESAVGTEAPDIFYVDVPAILLQTDGDPVFHPIPETASGIFGKKLPLAYLVNAPARVLHEPREHRHVFLSDNRVWYQAEAFGGPYKFLHKPTKLIQNIPDDHPRADIKKPAAIPARRFGRPPRIIVRSRPTVLLATRGRPSFVPVPGTDLKYCNNAQSDIFMHADGALYILAAGRWFTARQFGGPWAFVHPQRLPADFRRIPTHHPAAHVTACVAGTKRAADALFQATIPQYIVLARDGVSLTVSYDGTPRFVPIGETGLQWAENSRFDVLQAGEALFYCCWRGAWFSAAAASGPWQLCDKLPQSVALMPANSPLYHLAFVRVAAADADTVTYAYTAGYHTSYAMGGVMVYGSGSYTPAYVGAGFYNPVPVTYGVDVYYEAYHNGYAYNRSDSFSPQSLVALRADYNPVSGPWGPATARQRTSGDMWAGDPALVRSSARWRNQGYGAWLLVERVEDEEGVPRFAYDVYVDDNNGLHRWVGDEWRVYTQTHWRVTGEDPPAAVKQQFDIRRQSHLRIRDVESWRNDGTSTWGGGRFHSHGRGNYRAGE
jgi:hypothetical protein